MFLVLYSYYDSDPTKEHISRGAHITKLAPKKFAICQKILLGISIRGRD